MTRALVSGTDAAVLAGLPAMLCLAWTVPERHWPRLARGLAPLAIGGLTRDAAANAEAIRRTLGGRLPGLTGRSVLAAMAAEGIVGFLQVLKCHRPGAWAPATRLAGARHVALALQAGRGAVLWVAHGVHGHLGAKVAFKAAGFAVSHLSNAEHGFSTSRFGMRFLNPIQALAEDRHLAERLPMPLEGTNAALPLAVRRLRENRLVSLTAQRGGGRRIEAPFLDGRLSLAPGAPALAQLTGAALLPVFAWRDPDGIVGVGIEPPIAIAAGVPAEEALRRAVHDYVQRLEAFVLSDPGQWLGWTQL
jgi:lauroyl/myristoyl acyltransferase